MKRLARQQKLEAERPARKARDKALRKEKVAEKRKLIELGVIERPISKKAMLSAPRHPFDATVVLDLGFDDLMNEKVFPIFFRNLYFGTS